VVEYLVVAQRNRWSGYATFFVNVEMWRRVEKEISILTMNLSKKIRCSYTRITYA